ncbi:MAG: threonine synthase [Bacteroidota bacterium]
MKFTSTTGHGLPVSFKEAVLENLPGDGGLFFPSEIPTLDRDLLGAMPQMTLAEVATEVLGHFCGSDIDKSALSEINKRVFNFPIPLKKVSENIHCLELFHGPTFAFKDVGARFLAECLAYFNQNEDTRKKNLRSAEITVLVATSGDTGGAVARGFLGVPGVKVVILYPKGKVSLLQEKQLTTLGQNITALEVEGSFDDCQSMVKSAFGDRDITSRKRLSSANSINIARWLPQSIYYYVPFQYGWKDFTVAVPSGNYGNLTSGLLAMKMGVPIKSFIAATNANDVVPRYLRSGDYNPQKTIQTIANAMDVADPSNFKRLLALFHGSWNDIVEKIDPFTLDDAAIKETIKSCTEENEYYLDPHSAIAFESLKEKSKSGVFLGTAHYCKFLPVMDEAVGAKLEVPDFAESLMEREKVATLIPADYEKFKEYLLST